MNAKWLAIALGVSLVLNIGAVGYLIGSASSGGPKWRGPGLDPAMGIGRMMRVLPKEQRENAMDRDGRRAIRASLVELRQAQRAVDLALVAEPFDSERLSAALAAFRERFAASQAHSHAALVNIAAQLSPTERERFLGAMQRSQARGGPRRGEGARRSERE